MAPFARALGTLVCLAGMGLSDRAEASLGRDRASVEHDRLQLRASLRVSESPGLTIHELRLPGGTLVREYEVDGSIVAITFRGPFRPDLRQLLGDHWDAFDQAAAAVKGSRPGRGPLRVETPSVVVEIGGHERAFFGRAYLPGRLPASLARVGLE